MRSHDPDIYSNQFNWRDGAMILKENFKARDRNLPLRRLFPSEVIWQCYQTAAREANKKTSKLRIIVRHSVENESTLNAIWHAARNSTCTQDEVPDLGYKVYTDVDDGFYAILGSTNGASMMRMLIDHKSQIGFRTVERVVVLRCVNIEQLTEREKHRTILVELSAKRNIPHPPIFRRAGPRAEFPGSCQRLCAVSRVTSE
ncbi:hypothetical protein OEA41_010409 [Lepraria neglecta]|uniref:Uncharacterized protein n=1 Tax=Lepraria neglecta TaxID=209136 RepID=A0AAD9YZ17_9LECA|nr:hypothetical protein OEA41_010409 [Lepraria neglecta]